MKLLLEHRVPRPGSESSTEGGYGARKVWRNGDTLSLRNRDRHQVIRQAMGNEAVALLVTDRKRGSFHGNLVDFMAVNSVSPLMVKTVRRERTQKGEA